MREGVFLPLADPLGRKPGEALWPVRFSQEWLKAKRANIDLYEFEALYQQMPYLREGGKFKREWFTIVDAGPGKDVVVRVRAWDKAATEGGGARTAGVLMSKGRDGFYYVEHVAKGHFSSYRREKTMVEVGLEDYKQYGPFLILHPQDPGSAGLDSAQATNINLAEAGLTGTFETATGDKETRAGPLSTAAEAGRVRLVRGAWNEEYLDELVAFPKGRYKDQVDGSSSAFNKIIEIVNEQPEQEEVVVYEERVDISPY
jgi:predicted phage terminase large subunit-like protein